MHSHLSLEHEKVKNFFKNENGYAVAEFAITVPVLISIVSICFWVIGISINKFKIENYANQAARIIARGESLPENYLSSAPKEMSMTIEELDSRIKVETRLITKIPFLGKKIELVGSAESLSETYVLE